MEPVPVANTHADVAQSEVRPLRWSPLSTRLRSCPQAPWFFEQDEQFERGSADSEVDAIKALQAGRTDLAVVPVRAFGLVGVRSFDALIAPMEVDSMSLQQQVLSSDVATDMVSGVEGLGLKGIGILPWTNAASGGNHQTAAHAE